MVYLIATLASDHDYVSMLLLKGALAFVRLGTALLLSFYQGCKCPEAARA